MLIMTKQDFYKNPACYRSKINGKPYLLTLDKLTGATILAPVLFTSKLTISTI